MQRILPFFLLFTTSLLGVQTQSKVFEGYSELSDGELEGVAVHWDGGVGIGPSLGEGTRPPQGSVIWDLAPYGDDLLYIATGGPGAVYRMETATGEMKKVLDPDEPLLRAIHVDADGNLFAGTSPEGRIYRVAGGEGFPEIFADLESMYVWSIQADPENEGALLVAAGSPGRIYRLAADFSPGDEPEIVVEADTVHVTTFTFAPDGSLYYATGPDGFLVHRIDEEQSETIVELGRAEIRKIFPSEDGTVQIAVFRSDDGGSLSGSSGDDDEDSSAPDGLSSGIFHIGLDGFVQILLAGSDEKVFSAAMLGGEMLIGSDSRGRVYRFEDRFDWSLLAESQDGGEVSHISVLNENEAWIATSNPAVLYQLNYDPTASGTFTGEVFDAGQQVRWGALLPVGADLDGVTWETRTGNRSQPDETWGDWTALADEKVSSKSGRFFQYRAQFDSPNAVVRRIELFYQLPNEAPLFRRVEGLPVRLESIPMPPQPPSRATLPQLFGSNGNGNGHSSNGNGPQPFVVREDPGWLSIVWEAMDPNHDELRYRVFLRQLGESDWFLLAEDLKDPFFSLNISGFDPGYYEPRIVASDRLSNPPDLAKTSETRGNLILIDNQPPTITPPTAEAPTEFTVSDDFSIITSVSYRLEGSEDRALLPVGGIFDSREETFRLPDEARQEGATLHIEATDASGNRAAWTGLVPGSTGE